MSNTSFVSQIDIATAIMDKVSEIHPGHFASTRQCNVIFKAASMVSEALSTPDTRSVPGEGLEAWLKTDDVGASSKFMASVLAEGIQINASQPHPHDPSDFIRCRKLILAAPEWEERLSIMADVSMVWSALIEHWQELCAVMDSEAPNWRSGEGKCPETYALMKKLGC